MSDLPKVPAFIQETSKVFFLLFSLQGIIEWVSICLDGMLQEFVLFARLEISPSIFVKVAIFRNRPEWPTQINFAQYLFPPG
jgi:hypothetical protein